MAGGGRDQLGPIERLVRLLAVLESAGQCGAGQQQLLDVARYGGAADDQRRALDRELKQVLWAGTEHWSELLEKRAAISGALALSPHTRAAIEGFARK